jgi:hypothetical protein
MLQQTKTYGKDEIVLEMDEQIRIVTLCHNFHFRNPSNAATKIWSTRRNPMPNALKAKVKQDDHFEEESEGDEAKMAAIVTKQNV